MKFIGESYSLHAQDIHQIWCRSTKFLWKSKFCSESGSWYYFGFQYQTYISYMEDIHQNLFGFANSFKSYCVHMKSPRTRVHLDRQTEIFFGLFCLLRHTNHEDLSKGQNFFFTHAITILSLFTYSVYDEKVKMPKRSKNSRSFRHFFDRLGLFTFSSHTEYVKRESIVIALVK